MRETQDIVKALGKNIASVRRNLKMSQVDLAQKLGISQRVMCSYERGSRTMPVVMLPRIAEILNVSPGQLLNVEDKFVAIDERTRKAKLMKEVERLEKLPKSEQKVISDLIETLVKKETSFK